MVSICCWPPDSTPPRRSRISARSGNSANTCSSRQVVLPSGAGAPRDVEVLPDRELGKDAAVLGHEADAHAADAVRPEPRDVAALPHHPAAGRRRQADDRAHGRGLADAVAADQGDALAGMDLERHAEQDLAQAVGGVDGLDSQVSHGRCSPR